MRIIKTFIVRVIEHTSFNHLAKVHLVEGDTVMGDTPYKWILEHPTDGSMRSIPEAKFREYEKNEI